MDQKSLLLVETVYELLKTKAIVKRDNELERRNLATHCFLEKMHPDIDRRELTLGQLTRLIMEDLDHEYGGIHDGATCPKLLPAVHDQNK